MQIILLTALYYVGNSFGNFRARMHEELDV